MFKILQVPKSTAVSSYNTVRYNIEDDRFTVQFRGETYTIHPDSISIIGKTVIYSHINKRIEIETLLKEARNKYDNNLIEKYKLDLLNLPKDWEKRKYSTPRVKDNKYWCAIKPNLKVRGKIKDGYFYITTIKH